MASSDHEALNPSQRARIIKQRSQELGFHSCGITDLSPPPHGEQLTQWLDGGMAGTMTYMNRQRRKRLEPAEIVPGAECAIIVTRNYKNPDPIDRAGSGRVAQYARGMDYHATIKGPLNELAETIRALGDDDTVARAFVDAGPVPERELAQRAGLGWIGKNTMLIDPRAGSFFFIAEILTSLDLEKDAPFEADRCGSCTRCLDACPTNAFTRERVLDARRCISYLTIEHRGDFDEDARSALHGWIFGCDVCQTVCPWNIRFATDADDPILAQVPEMGLIELESILSMNEEEFEERYGATPLERPGLEGMQRNARRISREAGRQGYPAQRPVG